MRGRLLLCYGVLVLMALAVRPASAAERGPTRPRCHSRRSPRSARSARCRRTRAPAAIRSASAAPSRTSTSSGRQPSSSTTAARAVRDPAARHHAAATSAWRELRRGDLVEIEGRTVRGGFAPNIEPLIVRRLGPAPLPAPKTIAFASMLTGRHDCDYVEITGVVQRAWRPSDPQIAHAVHGRRVRGRRGARRVLGLRAAGLRALHRRPGAAARETSARCSAAPSSCAACRCSSAAPATSTCSSRRPIRSRW